MSSKSKTLRKIILSAMFLALALVLPLVTGQVPQIGNALCPMHIPVILCGFFCGPWCALAVGLIAPILRFLIFAMPPIFPTGIAMCFELATYGLISSIMYTILPKKKINIYISLLVAMVGGRIVWGIVRLIMYGVGGSEFGWTMFISGAFLNAIPGIIIQIILIPILVIALEKFSIKN